MIMCAVSITQTDNPQWGRCVQLTNGTVRAEISTEIGPRVLHFGFEDGANEFRTYPEERDELPQYGGHRLWHAPEAHSRTHVPDDLPVEYEIQDGIVRATREMDPGSPLRREIEVQMSPSQPSITVTHRIHNEGNWPVKFAPWGLTVLKAGGTAVLPFRRQAPEDSLQPDRSIQFWPYTHPDDDRLHFNQEAITVQQNDDVDRPLKIGTTVSAEWVAYVRDNRAFRKEITIDPDGLYPDGGSAVEVYTRSGFLELETLGTLETIDPDTCAAHTEVWTLLDNVSSIDALLDGAT